MKKAALIAGVVVAVLLFLASGAVQAQEARRTGEIASLDAAAMSFVIKTARADWTITVTDQTVIKEGDKVLKFADLKVGDHIAVVGERTGDAVEAREITREKGHEGGGHQHSHPM